MTTRRAHRVSSAFTLIEVVIALALVVAAAFAMALITLDLATAKDRAGTSAASDAAASLVFDRLEAALLVAEATAPDASPGLIGSATQIRVSARRQINAPDPFLPAAPMTLDLAFDPAAARIVLTEVSPAGTITEEFAATTARVRLRYRDERAWRDEWDSGTQGLPRAVEAAIWTRPRTGLSDADGPAPDRLRLITLVDAAAHSPQSGGRP
jgi:type II secretory pathway pseudopilin PulG